MLPVITFTRFIYSLQFFDRHNDTQFTWLKTTFKYEDIEHTDI